MVTPEPSFQKKTLSKKKSRILLTSLILFTVFLAYLSAIGIRAAGENPKFQEAMEILEQNADSPLPLQPGLIDSSKTSITSEDSLKGD